MSIGPVEIVIKILPIILLILLGMVFRRYGYLPAEVISGFKKTAVNITLPIVIFLSLLDLDFKAEYLLLSLLVFISLILLLLVGMVIRRALRIKNPYFPILYTSFENGMMGYGVLAVMFGQSNIYPIVLMDLGQTAFFALIFVTLMKILNSGEKLVVKTLIASFLKNSYVWASVLAVSLKVTGIAGFLRGIPLFGAILEAASLLGALTTPMMCLVIGYELKIYAKGFKKPLAVSLSRLALLLCFAFFTHSLTRALLPGLQNIFTVSIYAMFMLPPFFVGAALIKDEAEAEKQFALNVISINILLFLLLFPPLAALLAE
ncbi:MAG: hypothetical protein LBL96_00685 [Clostridiales bacterium]|jgi:predicted permease|nr:hypothetical protein [Clostridiales bacterium]